MTSLYKSQDALQQYMKEVAATRPLTSQEEVELATRIRKGDLEARRKLIEANLRFVVRVARQYPNQGVPLSDLIGAGNLGLISAAERFDETRGVKFISYAVWWIRQAILQTLAEHARVVRLPSNRIDLLRRISQYVDAHQQELARQPTELEIADSLGVSVEDVVDTMAKGRQVHSLDATVGEDEDSTLLETLQDVNQDGPDIMMMKVALREDVEATLDTLTEREREVLKLYFGLSEKPKKTLEEIGVQFGVTRERVRQIKEKALRKLRNPIRAKRLMPYVDEE